LSRRCSRTKRTKRIADGSFDGAATDVEVLSAQLGVAHAVLMLGEVLHDVEKALATALVAGPATESQPGSGHAVPATLRFGKLAEGFASSSYISATFPLSN
jgi:hypothetical protein